MAIHIKTDLSSSLVDGVSAPDLFHGDGDQGMKLAGMQKLVGGMIQIIRLNKPVIVSGVHYTHMGMNEEGKFSGKHVNTVATKIAKQHTSISHDDIIVGDAVLFESRELV